MQSTAVVGYQNNAFYEDWYTADVGVSFFNMGTADGSYVVTDHIFDNEIENEDQIMIFNPIAYNFDAYQFFANYKGQGPKWGHMDSESGEWTYIDSFTINNGDNIVYMPYNEDTTSITISGELADLKGASRVFDVDFDGDDEYSWTFPIANPYPVDTTAKMLADFIVNEDQILVWNEMSYNVDAWQYFANYQKQGPAWGHQDSETGEWEYSREEDLVIIPAGHGGIFLPYDDGVRIWTVTLEK